MVTSISLRFPLSLSRLTLRSCTSIVSSMPTTITLFAVAIVVSVSVVILVVAPVLLVCDVQCLSQQRAISTRLAYRCVSWPPLGGSLMLVAIHP